MDCEEINVDLYNGQDACDGDDETCDFRYLDQVIRENGNVNHPTGTGTRGEKDFEPVHTTVQRRALTGSRVAMLRALTVGRVHNPSKGVSQGQYLDGRVSISKPRGNFALTMGTWERGALWLEWEEALFLVDRGSLILKIDQSDVTLQGAYTLLASGNSLAIYQVYAHLKRLGYVVVRPERRQRALLTVSSPPSSAVRRLLSSLSWRSIVNFARTGIHSAWSCIGRYVKFWRRWITVPLVSPGVYTSYNQIFSQLRRIEMLSNPPHFVNHTQWAVTFHVYKPGSMYAKRRADTEPDFNVVVVPTNSEGFSRFPDAQTIFGLLDSVNIGKQSPKRDNALYERIKRGSACILLAIVEAGVISYVRVASTDFASTPVSWDWRSGDNSKTKKKHKTPTSRVNTPRK